jgi:hypothetical protein
MAVERTREMSGALGFMGEDGQGGLSRVVSRVRKRAGKKWNVRSYIRGGSGRSLSTCQLLVHCIVLELDVRGNDESGVDGAETPVQNTDYDLHGCGDEGDVVFDGEACYVVGYVGEETEGET